MRQQRRQEALQRQTRRLETRLRLGQRAGDQVARARLALFIVAALLSAFTYITWGARPWLAATAVAFIPFLALVALHRRVDAASRRAQFYLHLKQTHLARLALDWEELPSPLPAPERQEHPFAHDLDLLGARSLHHLLDTAVTQEGSARLRRWLLHTRPDPDVIRRRQTLIAELIPLSRFRDRLALQATLVAQSGRFSGQAMVDWLQAAPDPARLRPLLILLSLLSLTNITLFLAATASLLPNLWMVTGLVYGVLYVTFGLRGAAGLFRDVLTLQDALETAQVVFGFLETPRYGRAVHIQALCAPFLDEQERPSQYIRRARRVAAGVGAQQNPFAGFFLNALVPWNLFFAYQMGRCRLALQTRLPHWLDVWYELEALNSLANFAWLNPAAAVFPHIIAPPDSAAGAHPPQITLHARQIGHPLVAATKRVYNDFQVDAAGSVALITGSNMAGKSTFLRTLGVNLALAYAGGPVLAASLHTSLFYLFASIRIADSLTDGFSFFYAEVRRLQQLLAYATGNGAEPEGQTAAETPRPLFFLIDEIFRGTNNRERLIGSRAYIRALAQSQGAGLIATHDLELVHLAQENEKIRNFHFRDDVADGRMVFDYKLHPGPCPTTNALKIMRLAGLPVEEKEN